MSSHLPCHFRDRPDESVLHQRQHHPDPVDPVTEPPLSQLYSFYKVLVRGTPLSPSHSTPNNHQQHHAAESDSAAPSPLVTVDSTSDSHSNPQSPSLNPSPSHTTGYFHSLFDYIVPTPTRSSRKDTHLRSTAPWSLPLASLQRSFVGTLCCPALPPFELNMSLRRRSGVPATPRVISPSPTPSESEASSYFPPVTRSAAKRAATPQPLEEITDEDEPPRSRKSRTRSRSPIETARIRRLTSRKASSSSAKRPDVVKPSEPLVSNGKITETNGHLAPPAPATPLGWSWRDFSRSPSPLGLIPIHRHWRTFVHKHEVPRKVLHVSIGFVTLWLYIRGTQTGAVAPWLMAALLPIATVDYLRFNFPAFNRIYVMLLGALMRESEYSGWNGVIFYLLGAWIVLYFFPKDVGIMGVLLLSWCDTAASTFGRLYGRYTPRICRGKSLAGSFAAFLVGVGTSWFFWGWLAPQTGPFLGDDAFPFMFKNVLRLPGIVSDALGLTDAQSSISGNLALAVISLWSGLVAAGSEAVDIFGWDDNLTIPVLSGIGIWGFLKVFG
ncbi:hypothetical protein jhhlp_005598 [Lomentospora prolificans]|uniref:Phosphatidate cytidylyltransferase n=1 Tax=Lomentospora prolificans TaxID=41688 RepID=A0A2N3N3I8_9PEZI|nr:hypothetical protein jhhlp_005598 [Lomentospora prolificans]